MNNERYMFTVLLGFIFHFHYMLEYFFFTILYKCRPRLIRFFFLVFILTHFSTYFAISTFQFIYINRNISLDVKSYDAVESLGFCLCLWQTI